MKKVKIAYAIFLIFAFCFYFFWVFIYNMPKNYVKVKYPGTHNVFGSYFFQQWGFFAPPPKEDYRLYYIFYDKNINELKTIEVLVPLWIEKRKKNPFNTYEEIIDYQLYGTLNYVTTFTSRKYKELEIDGISRDSLNHEALEWFNNSHHNSQVNTLVNYGKLVITQNEPSLKPSYVKVKIGTIHFPTFSEYYFPDKVKADSMNSNKNRIAFESKLIKL